MALLTRPCQKPGHNPTWSRESHPRRGPQLLLTGYLGLATSSELRATTRFPTLPFIPRPQSRAYYDRKKAAGKTSMEALRCLKRRLSDLVYKAMLDDLAGHTTTGPGGQLGDDSDSSATGSQPDAGSSDKPLPGPATTKPITTLPVAS